MTILVDFNNVSQRLKDFEAEGFEFRYQESPLLRGLAYTLISLEWEGTPSILSDAFTPGDNDQHGFELTLSSLVISAERLSLSVPSLRISKRLGFLAS